MRRGLGHRLRRQRLTLQGTERHTFRWHMGFTLLDSAGAAILANAPLMATKTLTAADWQLNIPLGLSCVGMIAALHLGAFMADRPKKPFVVVPGLFYAAASLGMAMIDTGWLFLLVYGLGAIFEVATRPAVAAIVRSNYAADHRNHAMGRLRQCSAIVFLGVTMGSAWLLDRAGGHAADWVRAEMVLAGLLSLAAYLCFRRIRVQENLAASPEVPRPAPARSMVRLLGQDAPFRNYLIGFMAFAFFNLLYAASVVWAFAAKDLGLSYLACSLLVQVIPSVASSLLTGWLGAWTDRVGPWKAWGLIRAGWGLDPLLLVLAAVVPSLAALPLAVAARLSRGAVMGGSWVLSWQTGVSCFAPPGGETARYMGVQTFFNGLVRLGAAVASSLLLAVATRSTVLLVGGVGVLLSSLHAFHCARKLRTPST